MKVCILAGFLLVVVSVSGDLETKFQAFKVKHNKNYENELEERKRFEIFSENVRKIEEHNARFEQGLSTYKQGINKFADMTKDELKGYLGHLQLPDLKSAKKYIKTGADIPDSVDWRASGQVGPVEDQGYCGSCWAFAIAGVMESTYYRKTQKFTRLSKQQLVECSTSINYKCDGGFVEKTMPYVIEYGLETEEDYPYTGMENDCSYNASKVVAKIDDFVAIHGQEDALLEAVATVGPIAVCVDATNWFNYESGVYDDVADGHHSTCVAYWLNHAMNVVGYGSTANGTEYWILKNSWGTTWGEEGYIRLIRGKDKCGIAEQNVYPIMN